MSAWLKKDVPVLIGGDFNVIPEDIDCHKPASWIHDALFQPEPRAQYRAFLKLGYIDAFRSLHPGEAGRLGDAELSRGAGKAQFLGECDRRFHQLQFVSRHLRPPVQVGVRPTEKLVF